MRAKHTATMNRRTFTLTSATTAFGAGQAIRNAHAKPVEEWKPRWLVASCMYGYAKLAEILPELSQLDAKEIDLWPKVHGSQREELDELGEGKLAELLESFQVRLGCLTQYALGPFGLRDEIQIARRLKCPFVVANAQGKSGLGIRQKEVIADFAKRMKPEFALAADAGVEIVIENHGSTMLDSFDGIRWLIDYCQGPGFGFALAPAHLPQEPELIAQVVQETAASLRLFYAWQYGQGFRNKMEHEKEMEQMPGRGSLDFAPAMQALRKIRFAGPIEVMMHPTPRGIPIEPTVPEVTREIRAAQDYLAEASRAESGR